MNTVLGFKKNQTQKFLSNGSRIPVTEVDTSENVVIYQKKKDKDGYHAIQLGIGVLKNPSKALVGHIRGAKVKSAPRFIKEVKTADGEDFEKGMLVSVADTLKEGDIVDVIGVSKGKGFAGVVKRHHFKGGPRTHGQSDRERAPGSIGQTTTPGRVYKGKRMAGRMGHTKTTVKNLHVVKILGSSVFIKGLVPGHAKSLVMIRKVGENKKFVPLYEEEKKEEQNAKS